MNSMEWGRKGIGLEVLTALTKGSFSGKTIATLAAWGKFIAPVPALTCSRAGKSKTDRRPPVAAPKVMGHSPCTSMWQRGQGATEMDGPKDVCYSENLGKVERAA